MSGDILNSHIGFCKKLLCLIDFQYRNIFGRANAQMPFKLLTEIIK